MSLVYIFHTERENLLNVHTIHKMKRLLKYNSLKLKDNRFTHMIVFGKQKKNLRWDKMENLVQMTKITRLG